MHARYVQETLVQRDRRKLTVLHGGASRNAVFFRDEKIFLLVLLGPSESIDVELAVVGSGIVATEVAAIDINPEGAISGVGSSSERTESCLIRVGGTFRDDEGCEMGSRCRYIWDSGWRSIAEALGEVQVIIRAEDRWPRGGVIVSWSELWKVVELCNY